MNCNKNRDKLWSKITSPRPKRAVGGLLSQRHRNAGACNPSDNDGPLDDGVLDELIVDDNSKESKMTLPPRYRFRDLLLGDFAFNDDGER